MKLKNFLVWVFILYTQFCIYYIHYKFDIFNTRASSRNYEPGKLPQVDESLMRNPEWEQLNEMLFFRRTAAFYLIHKQMLKFYYLVDYRNKSRYEFDLNLKIEYENRVYNMTILSKDIGKYRIFKRWSYEFSALEAYVNIHKDLNDLYDVVVPTDVFIKDKFKIQAYLYDPISQSRTQYPLDVGIKQWREGSKNGSMICSGIHFGYGDSDSPSNYEKLSWWLEANRQFGFAKVVLTNNSIPDTEAYRRLFAKHEGFVEINQLQYLPNFMNNETEVNPPRYFRSFLQLNPTYAPEYNLFKFLIYNECFVTNIDTYQYILVQDVDELLIPRVNKRFLYDTDAQALVSSLNFDRVGDKASEIGKMLDVGATCPAPTSDEANAPNIDTYMQHIKKLHEENTYHFKMDHHLNNDSVNNILTHFAAYFDSSLYRNISSLAGKGDDRHEITITDVSFFGNITYTILFEGEKDINYGKNLVKLYQLLVDGLRRDNNRSMSALSAYNHFDRFLVLNGDLTSWQEGKTLHNTDISLEVGIHFPEKIKTWYYTKIVDYNNGHMSHFRWQTNLKLFNKSLPRLTMNVKDLKFDFNYFYCYFPTMLKSIASSMDVVV